MDLGRGLGVVVSVVKEAVGLSWYFLDLDDTVALPLPPLQLSGQAEIELLCALQRYTSIVKMEVEEEKIERRDATFQANWEKQLQKEKQIEDQKIRKREREL